jgi:hypothetical protein
MTSFGDVSGLLKNVSQSSSSGSIINGLVQGGTNGAADSLFSGLGGKLLGTSPLGELGIMKGFGDPLNAAMMLTPLGAPLSIMQMMGLPPLTELLDKLGVTKILKKIPLVGSLFKGLGSISKLTSSITDGVKSIGKKIGGGIKKLAKKL